MMIDQDHNRQTVTSRRAVMGDVLRHAGAGYLGLNLWSVLRAQAAAETLAQTGRIAGTGAATRSIRACIFVFYYGGPSHLDTFDMKPNAPAEIRGEFKTIASSVAGLRICEHLPRLSRIMDKVAIVRSMHHANRLHDSASTETFTGRLPPKGDREEFAQISQFFPCHGAALHYARRHVPRDVQHALLPWRFHNVIDVPCQGGGFLGSAYDPFAIQGEPTTTSYQAAMLQRPKSLTMRRINDRRTLLRSLQQARSVPLSPPQAVQMQSYSDRAVALLQSESLQQALDIKRESDAMRQRYGLPQPGNGKAGKQVYGSNLRGQNLLLARRLVEAGVPFVNVHDFRQQGQNWDSHSDNFNQHKKHLLPPADQSLSALIEDLDQRGLLDSTLVVALGEFGRTPKINANAGRDHWPDCYSVLLAGGGVRGGTMYGASDKLGAYPADRPVSPADLAATIYWRFGVAPTSEIHDAAGRPYRLSEGQPLKDLFG